MAEAAAGAFAASTMPVVVVYSAAPGDVQECTVHMPRGATVGDALAACGVPLPEGADCGVWGRVCPPDQRVQPGDRVELYRPLTVDPKVARRERFARQGARHAGLFAKRRPNSKSGY